MSGAPGGFFTSNIEALTEVEVDGDLQVLRYGQQLVMGEAESPGKRDGVVLSVPDQAGCTCSRRRVLVALLPTHGHLPARR